MASKKPQAKNRTQEQKKLYRSKSNRLVAGVCGGIAEYFDIDPTIVRLLWVILSLVSMGVAGILVYLAAWTLIPENPE